MFAICWQERNKTEPPRLEAVEALLSYEVEEGVCGVEGELNECEVHAKRLEARQAKYELMHKALEAMKKENGKCQDNKLV